MCNRLGNKLAPEAERLDRHSVVSLDVWVGLTWEIAMIYTTQRPPASCVTFCRSEMSQGVRRTDRFHIAHVVLILIPDLRSGGVLRYLLILFGNSGETVGVGPGGS